MPVVTPHHANNSNEWREKYENSALWPLCLIVVSIDHRSEQPTPSGTLAVTNVVLRNGDGNRVEASGWQRYAGVLASLTIGNAYWFVNCSARARYQQSRLVVVVLFLKQMPLPLMRTKTTIRLTIVLVSPCVHVLLNDGLLRGLV
ncbi:hypothetical protein niasHT_002568 [Heterodera trifolii]|uniref:Uncharacterized protein n=1 Tax=Heterodera trifolii TaxID=157864 RepID=A0ABD2LTZ5_9BILA